VETQNKRSPRSSISVYLVVQNRLVRETLVRLFQKRDGICVVGEGAYSQSTAKHLADSQCEVLLVDSLELLASEGLSEDLNDCGLQIKQVLFGMDEDPQYFLKAVRLGVSAYLLKEASSIEIIAAVKAVAHGEAVCPPALCMTLFQLVQQQYQQRSGLRDPEAFEGLGLTFRQRQLMALVAQGMTNKEIAASLNLSEFTVKNHIHRVMKHVDADSRHQAVDVIRAGGYPLSI
jgi:DNA-binding NarL/FixJ family response regulator